MSDRFIITLNWQPAQKNFTYADYSREYSIESPGKAKLIGTAAVEYKGSTEFYNPEDMLVASLSACHMLSYLAFASNSKVTILSYQDQAEGFLHKEGNIIKFKEVILKPKVVISADSSAERAEALHDKAHQVCFIANSVNFPVHVQAEIVTG